MRLNPPGHSDHSNHDFMPDVTPEIMQEGTTLGIQGGQGSFNEEAAQVYIRQAGLTKVGLNYLYTSPGVMTALCRGKIDRGQCAIYNSTGGYVEETTEALEQFPVRIVEVFSIQIAHALMIHPMASFDEITTVMAHPQVFAQCRKNLAARYPHLQQRSGEGELIDNAKTAEALSTGKLPIHAAVMGSKVLADIYGLKIEADHLQDLKENFTYFIHVVRK